MNTIKSSAMHTFLVGILLSSVSTASVIGCRNPGDRWIRNGLSGGQKAKLVAVHNAVRNKVASGEINGQPPAQNMRELVWDDRLAQEAQKWADYCVFEHDPHRVYPGGGYFGQNLYLSAYRELAGSDNMTDVVNGNVEDGVWAWYNEVGGYRYQAVTMGNFARAGHYTQEVWADTNRVGCGYTIFQSGGWNKQYLVCNYYHGGNIIGQYPYVSGSRNCGKFHMNPSRNYGSLCA